MATKKNDDFEETMVKLEEVANSLQSDEITLEEAIKKYEDGIKFYHQCIEILDKAKQKIEYLNTENDDEQ